MVYAQYANVKKETLESLREMFRKEISKKIADYTLSCNVPELTCQLA